MIVNSSSYKKTSLVPWISFIHIRLELFTMASGVKNQAAYIVAEKKSPLEVRDAPTPQPADDEVVIKVAYAAINPTDWKVFRLRNCFYTYRRLTLSRCKIMRTYPWCTPTS